MAKDSGPWKDGALRRLAKKPVALPVEVAELDHATLIRRTNRLILILVSAEFVAFAILFAVVGVLPGFVDQSRFTEIDPQAELWLAAILFGVPLLTGLLIRWLIHARIRRRPDEADHPWRFRVTADGMEVASAQDRHLAGPWANWTWRGYSYLLVKGSRIPTALHLACEDTGIVIEFSRFRRREATQIIRAVLQGLASVGHTDR
ncbi:MAG TPA: hypothetical protein VJL84_01975 [Kiloniellales bacterium]|nr:hypothetical protein [Kiloniellales bacterium]